MSRALDMLMFGALVYGLWEGLPPLDMLAITAVVGAALLWRSVLAVEQAAKGLTGNGDAQAEEEA